MTDVSIAFNTAVKVADETNAAFLARVNSSNPDTVSLAAAELFKQSPTQATVKDLAGIASSTDAANADMAPFESCWPGHAHRAADLRRDLPGYGCAGCLPVYGSRSVARQPPH